MRRPKAPGVAQRPVDSRFRVAQRPPLGLESCVARRPPLARQCAAKISAPVALRGGPCPESDASSALSGRSVAQRPPLSERGVAQRPPLSEWGVAQRPPKVSQVSLKGPRRGPGSAPRLSRPSSDRWGRGCARRVVHHARPCVACIARDDAGRCVARRPPDVSRASLKGPSAITTAGEKRSA